MEAPQAVSGRRNRSSRQRKRLMTVQQPPSCGLAASIYTNRERHLVPYRAKNSRIVTKERGKPAPEPASLWSSVDNSVDLLRILKLREYAEQRVADLAAGLQVVDHLFFLTAQRACGACERTVPVVQVRTEGLVVARQAEMIHPNPSFLHAGAFPSGAGGDCIIRIFLQKIHWGFYTRSDMFRPFSPLFLRRRRTRLM